MSRNGALAIVAMAVLLGGGVASALFWSTVIPRIREWIQGNEEVDSNLFEELRDRLYNGDPKGALDVYARILVADGPSWSCQAFRLIKTYDTIKGWNLAEQIQKETGIPAGAELA